MELNNLNISTWLSSFCNKKYTTVRLSMFQESYNNTDLIFKGYNNVTAVSWSGWNATL